MRTKQVPTPQKSIRPVTMLTVPYSAASAARAFREAGINKFPDLSKTVRFELVIDNPLFTEPVLVVHYGNYYDGDPTRLGFETYIPVEQVGNHYFFDLGENSEMQYFSIRITEKLASRKMRSHLFQYYHFEPGDNIIIRQHGLKTTEKRCKLSFKGKGAAKYRCQHEIKNVQPANLPSTLNKIADSKLGYFAVIRQTMVGVIEKYATELSPDSYQLQKLDIICMMERDMVAAFQERLSCALKNEDQDAYAAISVEYRNERKAELLMEIPGRLKYKSREYAWYMVTKYVCDYIDQYQHINYMGVYYEIMKTADCDLRDRMIVTFFILHYRDFRNEYRSLADHAITHLQNMECLEMLIFLQHRSYINYTKY